MILLRLYGGKNYCPELGISQWSLSIDIFYRSPVVACVLGNTSSRFSNIIITFQLKLVSTESFEFVVNSPVVKTTVNTYCFALHVRRFVKLVCTCIYVVNDYGQLINYVRIKFINN